MKLIPVSALATLAVAACATAPVVADIGLEVGAKYVAPVEDSEADYELQLNLTHDSGAYIWSSYGETDLRVLGQNIGDTTLPAAGIGFDYDFAPKLSAFIEVGHVVGAEVTTNDASRNEIVVTQLVAHHDHDITPWEWPAGIPGKDPDSYTEYEMEFSWLTRVGVAWQVHEHVAVKAAWRYTQGDEYYAWYRESNRAEGLGWWEESQGYNLNAFEVGVYATF